MVQQIPKDMTDEQVKAAIQKAFSGYDGCCNCCDCEAKRVDLRALEPIAREREIEHPWIGAWNR